MTADQSTIEVGTSLILRNIELADRFAEMKNTCKNYERKYEKEFTRLTGFAAQHTFMEQETTDIMTHAWGGVMSLAASLKKAQDEI